jgi:hypothetical protein
MHGNMFALFDSSLPSIYRICNTLMDMGMDSKNG